MGGPTKASDTSLGASGNTSSVNKSGNNEQIDESGNGAGNGFSNSRVTFDKSGNTLVDGKITRFAGSNERDSYFTERGVGNNGIVTNQDLFKTADFSNLQPGASRDNAQQQGSTFESGGNKVDDGSGDYHLVDTAGRTTFEHDQVTGKDTIIPFKPETDTSISLITSSKPPKEVIKPSDYGYTDKAVLDPRIKSLGENKSPLEINFDVTQAGKSAQAGKAMGRLGANINSGGGVETAKSKELGDKYSTEKLNSDYLIRDSLKENQKIKSEADRASSISFSNADYATGGKPDVTSVVTIGPKEEMAFGKTVDDQFGWHDIGKTQLSRGSALESDMLTPEADRASGKTTTNGGNNKTVLLTEDLKMSDSASGKNNPSTSVLGSKSNLSKDEIARQNRDYADYIGKNGQEGATINLFSNGKLVGSVSGKQAYRDAIIISRNYPNGLEARAVFSTTREGKQFTDSIIQSARQTNAPDGSILVFDTSKSVFPLKDQGRVVASIPLNNAEKELPSVIDKYAGNPNIKFGSMGTVVDTTQKTTTVPASILPLDLANLSSKYYTGKYFDAGQFFGNLGEQVKSGLSKPLIAPNATTNQFGITLPDASVTIREFGSNFGAFVAGGVKTVPPLLYGLGTSYFNFFNSSKINTPSTFEDYTNNPKTPIEFGSSGGPGVKVDSAKALANVLTQSLVEPTAFMGEKATQNYGNTARFIHEDIGNPIRSQGIETPVAVSSPKTLGAFGGTLAGIGTMLPTEMIPLRIVDLPFSIVTKEGKVFSQPKGIAIGYGGARSVPLVLKTPEGYKIFPNVKNTVESILPSNTGSMKYSVSRTQELSTLQGYQSKVINSETFRNRVDELGLGVKNTGKTYPGGALPYDAMEAARLTEEVAKGTQKAKNTGPLRPLASEEQASISPSVITPLGETIAKQQSPSRKLFSVFTLYKLPNVKNVQGSQLTYSVLSDKGSADFLAMRGGPHDVDITTGTALSFREEENAANAAKEAQLNIGRSQGLEPTQNTAYRGLDVRDLDQIIAGKKRIEQTSTSREVYASPESGTALFYGRLFHGKNASLAKLTYTNENDVLRFEEIPKKARGGKNPIQNWRTANPILIDYARNRGAKVLRKPIKTGGREDIILDTGIIQSIEKISPDIQVIRQEGKRLYATTPEGEEKIAEFLTKHDSTETGSMMGKASKVYGENIATKSFKYEVPGSKKKISGFGRKYQTQTQFARTGLFTKEQAEGHNASERQLELIGEKTAFGPELYKKSAIIDAYLLARDQSKELMKSPRTRESGKSMFESNEKLLKVQADLYEIDLSKPLASSGKNDYDLSSFAQSGGRESPVSPLVSAFGNTSRLNPNLTNSPQNIKSNNNEITVYHGTSLESAKKIEKSGIEVAKPDLWEPFGGFFVTRDIGYAKIYGENVGLDAKLTNREEAIVKFTINHDDILDVRSIKNGENLTPTTIMQIANDKGKKAIERPLFDPSQGTEIIVFSRDVLKNPEIQGLESDTSFSGKSRPGNSVSSGKNDYDLSSLAQSNGKGSKASPLLSSFGNTSRLNQNVTSTISFGNSAYSRRSSKSGLSGSMIDSSLSARVSSFSRLSARSGKSKYSAFSAKSAFSQRSSKSGKSGNSSVLSSLSGLSALSSMSDSSLSPGPSSNSGSSQNSSASSGISGISSFSGFSKMFGFSTINNQRRISLPIIPGNIGRKRHTPKNDNFTALFKFDVKNPFSTSLSIIERGNLTWL
jgi:hypothetical protein